MRLSKTDFFFKLMNLSTNFLINSICVGTQKMQTFQTRKFILRDNEKKIPDKNRKIKNLNLIFQKTRNAHEDILMEFCD